jgi:hypothetical protein
MLVKTKEKIVRRKVTINVPGDGDAFVKATVHVTMKILPHDESRNLDAGFFKGIITNIEGLVEDTPEKTPLAFTPENLEWFVGEGYILSALQRAYIDCTVAAGRGN